MHLGFGANQFGTKVSKHRCDACGKYYTVCPAIPVEKAKDWDGCMSTSCETYDMSRDADLLFDMGVVNSRENE